MRVNSLPRAPISPFYLEPTQSKHMRLIDLTVHIPATTRSRPVAQEAEHPARWKTLEFRIYSVFIFIIVLIMGWIPMTLSSRALAVRPSSGLRIQTEPIMQRHILITQNSAIGFLEAGCLAAQL
jgi:hypothetical protein